MKNVLKIAATAVGLMLGLHQSAYAIWSFDTATPTNIAGTTSGDPTVSLSGVYATNNASGVVSGTWSAGTLTNFAGNGQGMNSDGSSVPNHALDNRGNTEAVLMNFSSSVVLSSIGLGYTSNGVCKNSTGAITTGNTDGSCPTGTTLQDSGNVTTGLTVDLSLFRWVGTGAPTGSPTSLVGQSATTMTGWQLVGNYGEAVKDTSNPYNVVNTTSLGSSWWLVSAYNSGFAQTANVTQNVGVLDNNNDFFKLYAVAGTKCTSTVAGVCGPSSSNDSRVPEPGTLALASLALFGVGYSRRRADSRKI